MIAGGRLPADWAPATVVGELRSTFATGRTRPLAWRKEQLRALRRLLTEEEASIGDALAADLGKGRVEAWLTELAAVVREVDHAIHHVDEWAGRRRVRLTPLFWPGRAWIQPEPLGVVLVVAPWNYPVHLTLLPTVHALAAGNCVVVKPSELAPATSALLARLVTDHVDAGAVAVMEGGPETAAAIVDARVDHVFYTGGADGARAIMACAARHPTPVTLELGGKCPAIVERSADVRRAARRIAWGKFVNAGQTCTAPDYVLVDAALEADLLGELRRATDAMYGRDPRRSPDYGRIASEAHVDRLVALLDGHEIVFGGTSDRGARYLAPTMLRDVDLASPVMHEEIFGPILPVVSVAGVDEAIAFVRARPAPLALYLFTGSQAVVDRILAETTSGGATVNATMLHAGVLELPFGGTGASGFGASHGRAGFDTFSHARSVLVKGRRPEPSVAYPPYARWKERLLRHFTTR